MSEEMKMLSGEWYDANFSEELIEMRMLAKSKCDELNAIKHNKKEERQKVLKNLFSKTYENLEILSPFTVDYGKNITFGKNCFVNHYCYFMDGAKITIGNNVFFGPYTGLYTATHPLPSIYRNEGLEKAKPITIGNDCWLGANVSIMPGVTIGSGCVIGAGSVVTQNIPDNSLVVGVPGKVISKIDQSALLDR
ncbi:MULTISPECIES: sugar O-acetyltransferase [Enterococcus]|uniref:sugar O-acetyltransferase n=1 Tax=Enterococcus TaxID=1350 RepID=UPI000789BAC7|nr:sugar O-acetyltransferase [Enterococcus pernyi]UOO46424.1 sugar O-acetyltransferase [Enterococcus casseliflavus]